MIEVVDEEAPEALRQHDGNATEEHRRGREGAPTEGTEVPFIDLRTPPEPPPPGFSMLVCTKCLARFPDEVFFLFRRHATFVDSSPLITMDGAAHLSHP